MFDLLLLIGVMLGLLQLLSPRTTQWARAQAAGLVLCWTAWLAGAVWLARFTVRPALSYAGDGWLSLAIILILFLPALIVLTLRHARFPRPK